MKKNILIADDSALMRRVLSDIINKDDRFYVADVARNGEAALALLKENAEKYDVVLLDFFMPDMNADELLLHLHKKIKAKVIVISGIIKSDAMEIIYALEHGAFDFVTKPENFAKAKEKQFGDRLLKCIELAAFQEDTQKEMCNIVSAKSLSKRDKPISINQNKNNKKSRKGRMQGGKLIALACSTGGPKALQQVIPKLPADLAAPMIVVQHMPKGFTKSLAERLDQMSEVKVKEAEDGEVLTKGVVYIAKGGSQLRVDSKGDKSILRVTEEAARNGLKPCADIMYESLVDSTFEEIICVVLTGMGGDGTEGIKQLSKKNNIYSITQTADTCTVYGMPKVFYQSGLADEVVPLQNIAGAIRKHMGVQ